MTHPEKINFVVVGAGHHSARSHIDPLLALPESCRIVAVSDPYPGSLDRLHGTPGLDEAAKVTDWREAMEHPTAEAVIITSPDKDRFEQASAAIDDYGLHVLSEKPFPANMHEANALPELLDRAKHVGKVFQMCYPREFGEPWGTLKGLIHDRERLSNMFGVGDLGKAMGISFTCQSTVPQEGSQELYASFAEDKSGHDMNTVCQLFGDEDSERGILLEDEKLNYSLLMRRYDGLRISSSGSRTIPRDFQSKNYGTPDTGIYNDTVQIDFERGRMTMDAPIGRFAVRWGDTDVERQSPRFATDYAAQFIALHEHFIDHIRDPYATPAISKSSLVVSARSLFRLKAEHCCS